MKQERRANHGATGMHTESPCPFYLEGPHGSVAIRGEARWLEEDRAYVLVPYGTARAVRENWNAFAYVPDPTAPDRSVAWRMNAELLTAEQLCGPEGSTEGLLLRISGVTRSRRAEPAPALLCPSA